MAKTGDGETAHSPALLEYIGRAITRERELEGALAAHLVVATKPSYQRRIEEYLRSSAGRVEHLQAGLGDGGGAVSAESRTSPRKGVEEATRALGERAVALAEGGLGPEQERQGAARMVENAGAQQQRAAELSSAYGVIAAVADAASEKKTAKLAKQCRDEHDAMRSYLEDLIPKLAKSLVRAEQAEAAAREQTTEAAADSGAASGTSADDGSTPATRTRSAAAKAKAKPARGARTTAGSSRSNARRKS